MIDFQAALDRKYAILQQQADASTTTANASAEGALAAALVDRTRAKLMPGESAANIGLTNAQAGLAGATMRKTDADTSWVDRLNRASIAESVARARYQNALALEPEEVSSWRPPSLLDYGPRYRLRGLPGE